MKEKGSVLTRLYTDKKWLTISNILTALRIFLAPLIVLAIIWQEWRVALCVFFLASVTDFFDGYCARLFNEGTVLGTMLDPLADKIFLLSMFFALTFLGSPSFYIPRWFFSFVVIREAIILMGSFVLLRQHDDFVVQPTMWGKLTTTLQLLFIGWIFICYFCSWSPVKTYSVVLFLLALFSSISLFQYIKSGLFFYYKAAKK